jgi:serine/threonine-protein kinase
MRFDFTVPASIPLHPSPGRSITISADGSTLAYATLGPSGIQFARRRLDELTPTLIAGTEGALSAELSPDGKWLAFFVDSTLKKVSTSGGPVTTLAVTQPGRLSWSRSDTIVIGSMRGDPLRRGLMRVAASGGAVQEFVQQDSAMPGSFRAPRVVDDAGVVLFGSTGATGATIRVAPLSGGASTLLAIPDGGDPLGLIDGYLVYSRPDGAIAAVSIDARNLRITGEPVPLIDDAAPLSASLADNGTLVYETGSSLLNLARVDQKGSAIALFTVPRPDVNPRFSPDGKKIALTMGPAGNASIWVFDMSVANAPPSSIRLTAAPGVNHIKPEWSADGKRILFARTVPDSGDINSIWSQVADGSAPAQREVSVPNRSVAEVSASKDGRMMAFRIGSVSLATNMDIWYRSLVGDTALKPVLTSPAYNERDPVISPDGNWLAYVSNESGRAEVYVRAFPGPDSKWPVSAGGGDEPMWSRDGRRLYYRSANKMMAASVVTTSGRFAITAREALFDDGFMRTANHPNYDVTPDGSGFLMVQRGDSASSAKVVINLGAELRMRGRSP